MLVKTPHSAFGFNPGKAGSFFHIVRLIPPGYGRGESVSRQRSHLLEGAGMTKWLRQPRLIGIWPLILVAGIHQGGLGFIQVVGIT